MFTLTSIFPIEGSGKKYLLRQLEALYKLNAITKIGENYAFKAQSLLEVAFSRLTFAQRSKLHLSIADLYESNPSIISNENLRIKLIAYHLAQYVDIVKDSASETVVRTITRLRLAGEAAARNGDSQEAFTWLNYAMSLLKDLPEGAMKKEIQKEVQLKIVGIGLNVTVVSIKDIINQAKMLDENYKPISEPTTKEDEPLNPLVLRNLTKFFCEVK